jgi:hypothetical protein
MHRIALLFVLLASPAQAFCQTPTQMAETFLARVSASPEASLDELFKGSGFGEAKPQELLAMKSQTRMAMGLYGAPLGFEKVREEVLSPSLVHLVYLQKFPQYPVAWEFFFYKPRDTWVINTLNFKDQIQSLVTARQ